MPNLENCADTRVLNADSLNKFTIIGLFNLTVMRRGHCQFPPTVDLRPPVSTWSSTSETGQMWPTSTTATVEIFVMN